MEERALEHFRVYNQELFEGKLHNVKLIFSEKMKTSAGNYFSDKNCERISLNRKLLSTRTDEEVKETLLHEMTHAYVQKKYGSKVKPHGKEFKEKISQINKSLGLNISTFHNFLSWWRCDGKCQFQPAHFYGYVTGSDDLAIFDPSCKGVQIHKELCGGNFQKTSEPPAEMLLELRRLKRKRCDSNNNNVNNKQRDRPYSKMIRYSTD